MSVKCERNCKSKGKDGNCSLKEIVISSMGVCNQYQEGPKFQPFCEDIVAVYDEAGIPSIMRRFKRMTNKELFDGSDKPHPMFVVGGEVQDEIYISVYPNVIINGKAYSLPMQKPAVNVTLEEAEKACFTKGEGWHLMTAVERGFLANLCYKHGTLPHGNTNYGKYHADHSEKGECFDGCKTLTGSGPATWNHDHTVFGVSDLCGNVWEWFRGLRLMDGVLQVAKDNDAAMNIDLSRESQNWQTMLADGKPICIDATEGIRFTNNGEGIDGDGEYDGCEWEDVEFDFGRTEQMIELGLFPGEPKAYMYADTGDERLPICGGSWAGGAFAGVFDVSLSSPRSYSGSSVGFRSAFYRKLNTEDCNLKGGC